MTHFDIVNWGNFGSRQYFVDRGVGVLGVQDARFLLGANRHLLPELRRRILALNPAAPVSTMSDVDVAAAYGGGQVGIALAREVVAHGHPAAPLNLIPEVSAVAGDAGRVTVLPVGNATHGAAPSSNGSLSSAAGGVGLRRGNMGLFVVLALAAVAVVALAGRGS